MVFRFGSEVLLPNGYSRRIERTKAPQASQHNPLARQQERGLRRCRVPGRCSCLDTQNTKQELLIRLRSDIERPSKLLLLVPRCMECALREADLHHVQAA